MSSNVEITNGDLSEELVKRLLNEPEVAIDTETDGLSWERDALRLVQLHSSQAGTILIRANGSLMPNLGALISDQKVVKVFHFAPFDLRFLSQAHSKPARNVRCTKAASKLLSPKASSRDHSLGSLLQREMHVVLNKGAVRVSEWGASTLSTEQVRYAASDVKYLLDLHSRLYRRIINQGLSEIYDAVCAYMPFDAYLETSGVPNPLTY